MLLDSDEKIILKLLEPFVVFLVGLIATAPGYQEELDHLDARNASRALRARAAHLQAHVEERAAIDREHWANVERELKRISTSSNGQERALFAAITNEVHPGGLRAFATSANVGSAEVLTSRLAFSGGAFSRYIRWVGRLKHYRADIIAELIDTYGGTADGVRLFTPALVDFEFWLNDAPETNFTEQIELGSRLSRAFPGRVHFFVPFDPWREVAHAPNEPGSLELVKKAITQDGFVGVKLYPPMGFAASGNAGLDFSAVDVEDSAAFGAQLDATLDALFTWAVEADVPIMAHCNLSEESKRGFACRASPAYWATAIAHHPGLRLNLGHFGGQDNLGPGGVNDAADWPETIIALMGTKEGRHLYTDIGNFDMGDMPWFARLKTALQDTPVLLDRLMYGSDWMMLATSDRYEDFFTRFRDGLTSLGTLDDAQIASILGGNARSFLGLESGGQTRARLVAFYDGYGIARPDWLG